MTPEDLAGLHALAMFLPPPWNAGAFASFLAMPGVILTGDSRAFLLGRVVLDEAEVLTLATHPDHRRQGLARACLTEFHTTAHAQGATTAFLEVATTNTPALTLYETAGYRRTGLRRGYYRRPDGTAMDATTMTRPLCPACPEVIA